jgi:hypothetical protein
MYEYVCEDATCISVPNKDGDLRQRTDQHCHHGGRSTTVTVKFIDFNLVMSPRGGSKPTRTDWRFVICTVTDFVYTGLQWHVSPLVERLFPVPERKLALRMKTLPRSPCVKTELCIPCASLWSSAHRGVIVQTNRPEGTLKILMYYKGLQLQTFLEANTRDRYSQFKKSKVFLWHCVQGRPKVSCFPRRNLGFQPIAASVNLIC